MWKWFNGLVFILIACILMNFKSQGLIAGFALAYAAASITVPMWIKYSIKASLLDKPDERKLHDAPIPTMGGVGIYAAIAFAWLALPTGIFQQAPMLIAMAILLFTGVWDDRFDMPAKLKLLAQLAAAALAVYGAGLHELSFIPDFPGKAWISFVAATIFIGGMINAMNFLDGVDGLCAGIGLINTLLFALFFAWAGYPAEATACAVVGGGALGFLRFNLREDKALVFMGDTGSMLLGWFSAVAGLFIIKHGEGLLIEPGFDTRIFVTGVFLLPVFDAIRIILIRLSKGLHPFSADRRHMHHILQKSGFNGIGPTTILWASHAIMAFLGALMATMGPVSVFFPALLFAFAIALAELLTFRRLGQMAKQERKLQEEVEAEEKENFFIERRLKDLRL